MLPPEAALNVTTVFQLIVLGVLNFIHKNEPQPRKNEVFSTSQALHSFGMT
jgi:hypothetical protein